MDAKEPFLSRWSRRKLETKEEVPAGASPAAQLTAADPAAPLPQATRPPEAETAERGGAEYKEFFDPQVDEKLRRTALKKLFGDPHFNVMDGLDTYIDDYSKPDPVPEAMLRQLNQAKDLFLFDDKKQAGANASDDASAGTGKAAIPVSVAAADTTTLPESPPPPTKSDAGR